MRGIRTYGVDNEVLLTGSRQDARMPWRGIVPDPWAFRGLLRGERENGEEKLPVVFIQQEAGGLKQLFREVKGVSFLGGGWGGWSQPAPGGEGTTALPPNSQMARMMSSPTTDLVSRTEV